MGRISDEARYRAERDALLQAVERVADDMERHCLGHEIERDAPVVSWIERLRMASASVGHIVADDGRCATMPEGMEWPRFEDDAPVRIGDDAVIAGRACAVSSINFADHCWTIAGGGGHEKIGYGERVKRPAKVLDADGAEIRVGETLWFRVTGEKFHVTALASGDSVYGKVGNDIAESEFCAADLTHERPDSWERLEEDAESEARLFDAFDPDASENIRNLMRRARALAGEM